MTLQLTETDVIELEAHDIHCPWHALMVVRLAARARKKDRLLATKGQLKQPCFTEELSKIAGLCQKVVVSKSNRNEFKRIYSEAYANQKFRRQCHVS